MQFQCNCQYNLSDQVLSSSQGYSSSKAVISFLPILCQRKILLLVSQELLTLKEYIILYTIRVCHYYLHFCLVCMGCITFQVKLRRRRAAINFVVVNDSDITFTRNWSWWWDKPIQNFHNSRHNLLYSIWLYCPSRYRCRCSLIESIPSKLVYIHSYVR